MTPEAIAKYNARVPRYTSYPTAAQFHDGVGPQQYGDWLTALPAGQRLSLYLHVPYCRSLCWYCGCNMRVVNRDGPIDRYCSRLMDEIDLVADHLKGRGRVGHLHWGGGTPSVVGPLHLAEIMQAIRNRFDIAEDAEIAMEIDPRVLDGDMARAMGEQGFNRASIGIQDLNAEVQQAVNRIQTWEQTRNAADLLRAAGIDRLNLDLIYGLPNQTVERVERTVEACLALAPERIALFGYAHVPWMKKHQRLIDEASLPGAVERLRQYQAAADLLTAHGYITVGLDHFAKAGSEFADTARSGRLKRNFQGYTEDDCNVLVGLGASAISDLPQGLVQNDADLNGYLERIAGYRLASRRGVARTPDDRLRADIIEALMCNFRVDLDAVCRRHGATPGQFADAIEGLAAFTADGLATRQGNVIAVTDAGRPIVRAICALFDAHLRQDRLAHAAAV